VSSASLKRLRRLVDEAIAAEKHARVPGARVRIPQEFFTQEAWNLAWEVVRYVREHDHDLYANYLLEQEIAGLIIDQFLATSETPKLDEIVADLRRRTVDEGEWLIQVPLMNAEVPRQTVSLGDEMMLVATDQEHDWSRFGTHLSDVWAIPNHFHLDALTIRPRWLRAPSPEFVDVDTTVSSVILLVQRGTEELALDVARARARFAVSMWCLLKRPQRTASHWPLWPSAGSALPAPHLTFGTLHKLYQPDLPFGAKRAATQGNWVHQHGPYRLPKSDRLLRAPFDAMRQALGGNTCAIALLEAARWLYLADREPNELERVERLLAVWNAREALCEGLGKGQGKTEERWERLVSRMRIKARLRRRGYTQTEIEQAFAWAKNLRDMTVHTAHPVLVALDYPAQHKAQLKQGRTLTRQELALPVVTTSWPILLEAVRFASRTLTQQAVRSCWDESVFHRRMNPPRNRRKRI